MSWFDPQDDDPSEETRARVIKMRWGRSLLGGILGGLDDIPDCRLVVVGRRDGDRPDETAREGGTSGRVNRIAFRLGERKRRTDPPGGSRAALDGPELGLRERIKCLDKFDQELRSVRPGVSSPAPWL